MACCAFAVFLLLWLATPLRTLARWLGMTPRPVVSQAALWRPGSVVPPPAPRRLWRTRTYVTVGALALMAGPATALDPASAITATAGVCGQWLGGVQ